MRACPRLCTLLRLCNSGQLPVRCPQGGRDDFVKPAQQAGPSPSHSQGRTAAIQPDQGEQIMLLSGFFTMTNSAALNCTFVELTVTISLKEPRRS